MVYNCSNTQNTSKTVKHIILFFQRAGLAADVLLPELVPPLPHPPQIPPEIRLRPRARGLQERVPEEAHQSR